MARNTITRYERGFLPTIPKYVALAVSALIRNHHGVADWEHFLS